jgi:hypothetical protein
MRKRTFPMPKKVKAASGKPIAVSEECCKKCLNYANSTSNKKTLAERLADKWGKSGQNPGEKNDCICYDMRLNHHEKNDFMNKLNVLKLEVTIEDCGNKTKVTLLSNNYLMPLIMNPPVGPTAQIRKTNKSNNRKKAGAKAKKEGHKFEDLLAEHIGLPPDSVEGGHDTKVDINAEKKYGKKMSVKNPSGKNTQVYLPTQETFSEAFALDQRMRDFLKLFLGCANDQEYRTLCKKYNINMSKLTPDEIGKYKVSSHFLPEELRTAALAFFNKNREAILHACLCAKPGESSSVDTLAWAWEKSNLQEVEYYDIECLLKRSSLGKWEFTNNGTVIKYMVDGDKVISLHRKGSGSKSGSNNPQFHVWNDILVEECKIILEVIGDEEGQK